MGKEVASVSKQNKGFKIVACWRGAAGLPMGEASLVASNEDVPAVGLANLALMGSGDGEGQTPRVMEAEGLSILQEEALLDEIFDLYVVQNRGEILDGDRLTTFRKAVRDYAMNIQMDDDLCVSLGGEPFDPDEILACKNLEELCWIPDDEWIDVMMSSFRKANDAVLLTERAKSAVEAQIPAPVSRVVAKNKSKSPPKGKLSSRQKSASSLKGGSPSPTKKAVKAAA